MHDDPHDRPLVRLIIDARDVAQIAIEEGWGRQWDGEGKRPVNWGDPEVAFDV
jgi:hypothetical protein